MLLLRQIMPAKVVDNNDPITGYGGSLANLPPAVWGGRANLVQP